MLRSGHGRLTVEFVTLFLLAPVAMAVFAPPNLLFPALFAVTAVGVILLASTPGFMWRTLTSGAGRINWRLIAGMALATVMAGTAIMQVLHPESFLLFRRNLNLMLMIALLYPFLSALPQELVFRPLFFARYAPILPQHTGVCVVLNAAIFALAHLMYWSWIVAGLTFFGGLIFAYSYRVRQNFAEALVAHSVAGVILFALGMGVFFYSGNVTRPF